MTQIKQITIVTLTNRVWSTVLDSVHQTSFISMLAMIYFHSRRWYHGVSKLVNQN